ncbi:MAG: TolC family protein [Firmicutes bacterium]|nr:TolC family protein [Bacillota bacterium]
MKKLEILAVLMVVILSLPMAVIAQKDEDYAIEEAVAIHYDRAVAMAINNSAINDIDELIEDMEEIRDDLRTDLRRLERGDWRQETVNALFEELGELEMSLFFAHAGQQTLRDNIEMSIQNLLDSMTDPDSMGVIVERNLEAAIAGILAAQGMSGNMAMMQMRLFDIFDEISRLQDGRQVQEMISAARRALNEMDQQMYLLRLQQRQSKLVMENTLRSLIAAVTELETAIETMEANLAIAAENLRRVTVRHNFGRASNNELRAARQALALEEMTLAQRKTTLYNARNSLNLLLGQPLSQYTVIDFDRTPPEIPDDLAGHIAEIIPTTPPIRQLQLDVDREHEAMRAYRGSDREKRAALREAYERAAQRRDQAMLTMEAALRRAYNDLLNLQTTTETQLLQLYRAQQALEVAETNLALGRVTLHEVVLAQQAVFQARQAITSTHNQKWTLAFRLENPSLLN